MTTGSLPVSSDSILPPTSMLDDRARSKAIRKTCAIGGGVSYDLIDAVSLSRLNVGCSDHLGPLFDFFSDKLCEIAGRSGKGRAA